MLWTRLAADSWGTHCQSSRSRDWSDFSWQVGSLLGTTLRRKSCSKVATPLSCIHSNLQLSRSRLRSGGAFDWTFSSDISQRLSSRLGKAGQDYDDLLPLPASTIHQKEVSIWRGRFWEAWSSGAKELSASGIMCLSIWCKVPRCHCLSLDRPLQVLHPCLWEPIVCSLFNRSEWLRCPANRLDRPSRSWDGLFPSPQ